MMATQEQKTVAFVLHPGLTLLDLVGPLQVFASLRQFNDQYRPVVVAERLEPMATDGPLKVIAAADTTPVVGSVCTGALVLAAAGCWRAARPPPTGPTIGCWSAWAPRICPSGGWRTASSSPRLGCRPGSTSPWPWWPG
jgi:transcriptional regulator GlxA family with amidase domain